MTGIQSGDQETHGFYGRCGLAHLGICRAPVLGYFRCSQECHYSWDYSKRKSRVFFMCCQPGHVKGDCPIIAYGMVLDQTRLAWQLPDGRHRTTGVPRVRV